MKSKKVFCKDCEHYRQNVILPKMEELLDSEDIRYMRTLFDPFLFREKCTSSPCVFYDPVHGEQHIYANVRQKNRKFNCKEYKEVGEKP